ncbi:MAG TPA: hypothetical protein DDW51_15335, partial [Cyanobacteria bacterium UBA11367]|nr:hypothetical protein [Cyanobacteria bacterium UBA11367]
GGTPVLASLQQVGESIVQTLNRPQVKLNLGAEKKAVTQDQNGKQQVSWQSLESNAVVQPGDVLRYTVSSNNAGDIPAQNLIVTQPISQQMIYIFGSAKNSNGAKITYSIDSGKNFGENPTIQVKLPNGKVENRPAPPETYTHIRWNFTKSIDPTTGVKASYEVKVK